MLPDGTELLNEGGRPFRRGEAIGALEQPRHVTLIGKTGFRCGLGERLATPDHPPRPIELPHRAEARGGCAEGGAKLTSQRPSIETRDALQRCEGMPGVRCGYDPMPNPP